MRNIPNCKGKEEHFTMESFAKKLEPILKENFNAETNKMDNLVILRFPNGQKIIVGVYI